jgi:nitrite reductase/ring-hydroxylating ferredoxin subunit
LSEPASRAVVARVAASEVREGELTRVELAPFHVLVTRVNGSLHAIEDACPHSGWSLCDGRIEGHVVTCPGHGWQIDVRTGRVLTEVGASESNPLFVAQQAGETVELRRRAP